MCNMCVYSREKGEEGKKMHELSGTKACLCEHAFQLSFVGDNHQLETNLEFNWTIKIWELQNHI